MAQVPRIRQAIFENRLRDPFDFLAGILGREIGSPPLDMAPLSDDEVELLISRHPHDVLIETTKVNGEYYPTSVHVRMKHY